MEERKVSAEQMGELIYTIDFCVKRFLRVVAYSEKWG